MGSTTTATTEEKPKTSMPSKELSQRSMHLAKELPGALAMEAYIYNANQVLEVALNPTSRKLPTHLLEECKGVAILSVFHAGAIMTMHYGTGVLLAKEPNGEGWTWSAPSSVLVTGYSMGVVAGGKVDSIIVLIMDDETMKDFAVRPQTRMGLDAALAMGKLGGDKSLGVDQGTVSMTFTTGAFAGVGLQVGSLVAQERQNKVFYGHKVRPKDILLGDKVAVPANSQIPDVYEKLDKLANGESWVPTQQDLDRSSHFLEVAETSSHRFRNFAS